MLEHKIPHRLYKRFISTMQGFLLRLGQPTIEGLDASYRAKRSESKQKICMAGNEHGVTSLAIGKAVKIN